jgi:spore maturation protein CgeB
MKIVVFGLTISSSWGNGHATLWRGLCRALGARGHRVTFFERDVPYYASHRDMIDPEGCDLRLYADWAEAWPGPREELKDADVGLVTSFCADAREACALVLSSDVPVKAYYDMDTPITLHTLDAGEHPPYIPDDGLGGFDVVCSYSGGGSLDQVATRLGARQVVPLYGSVDPAVHHRIPENPRYRGDLSYIGTYAADRQDALEALFLEPARRRPGDRFVLAGSQYPQDFSWPTSVWYLWHLAPAEHSAFYSSSRWTLNITRGPMAALGYCPSGRLFEAAACATPIVTDGWDGLDAFFTPGEEIVIASTTDDVLGALDLSDAQRRRIGARARERALDCHTAAVRAQEFERIVGGTHVGHRSSGRTGQQDATAGILERAAAGREPA